MLNDAGRVMNEFLAVGFPTFVQMHNRTLRSVGPGASQGVHASTGLG